MRVYLVIRKADGKKYVFFSHNTMTDFLDSEGHKNFTVSIVGEN